MLSSYLNQPVVKSIESKDYLKAKHNINLVKIKTIN